MCVYPPRFLEVAALKPKLQIRRDTSGCKPSFDLIEYAMRLDLPGFVGEHPVIKALNGAANDLVT